MSAGTDRITFRCPAALQSEMNAAINRHNAQPGSLDSLNTTSFLLRAIKEKVAHLERSRKKIKRVKRESAKMPLKATMKEIIGGPHHKKDCPHYLDVGDL